MSEPSAVADLVAGARAGDQGSWNDLVDRFLPLVTAVIGGFRLSKADADDVNQTVWLRLVEQLDNLREPRALPGWLKTTARREALRVLGTRKRAVPFDPQWSALDGPSDEPDFDDGLIQQEEHHALREAMLELPEPRRELLTLLMEEPPLSYEEIGRRLGMPVGSIGPTRQRALAGLRGSVALREFDASVSVNNRIGGRDVAIG